ncbi:MAG: TatD family hydrolase [Cyclobacteriaceae bacterium]
MIDTHSHIYSSKFSEDRSEMLNRAFQAGVERVYMPNIDMESIDGMMKLAGDYPDRCFPMMGLHPCSVQEDYRSVLDQMRPLFDKHQFVAVGEMGTDLYWDKSFFKQQQEAFRIQCEWALDLALPIVIHCRDSFWETVEMLKDFKNRGIRGVFHCFTGGKAEADAAIDLGFYLGVGGVATFKNGGLDKVLPEINLDQLLLETDAPYLAPVPHRGKRNEPAYTSLIAERLAAIKGVDRSLVIAETTKNAMNLFHPEEQ